MKYFLVLWFVIASNCFLPKANTASLNFQFLRLIRVFFNHFAEDVFLPITYAPHFPYQHQGWPVLKNVCLRIALSPLVVCIDQSVILQLHAVGLCRSCVLFALLLFRRYLIFFQIDCFSVIINIKYVKRIYTETLLYSIVLSLDVVKKPSP